MLLQVQLSSAEQHRHCPAAKVHRDWMWKIRSNGAAALVAPGEGFVGRWFWYLRCLGKTRHEINTDVIFYIRL